MTTTPDALDRAAISEALDPFRISFSLVKGGDPRHDRLVATVEGLIDRAVEEARREEREALTKLLSWWPEGSENSPAGKLKGSAFADDLAFARSVLSDAPDRDEVA